MARRNPCDCSHDNPPPRRARSTTGKLAWGKARTEGKKEGQPQKGAGRETSAVVRQEPAAIGASAATRSPFPVCQHRRSGVKRVERQKPSKKQICSPTSLPSGFRWQAQRPNRPENEWGSFSTDSTLNPYLETRRTSGTALAIPVPSWPRPRQTGKRRANHGRPCEENIQIWKGSDHAW